MTTFGSTRGRDWLGMAAALLLPMCVADVARADIQEMQVAVEPTLSMVDRHDRLNLGPGATVRIAYGVGDDLDAEFAVACDRIIDFNETGITIGSHDDAQLYYNAVRCSAVPSLVMRVGWRLVGTFSAGIGYRFERQDGRELATVTGALIEEQDAVEVHQLVLRLRAGLEFRINETFTVGLAAAVSPALAGGNFELDLSGSAVLGVYFYP